MDEWYATCLSTVDGRLKVRPFKPSRTFWTHGHKFGVWKRISKDNCWCYVAVERRSGDMLGKECHRLRDVEWNLLELLADVTPRQLAEAVDQAVQKHAQVIRAQQEIDALAEADAREARQFGELA